MRGGDGGEMRRCVSVHFEVFDKARAWEDFLDGKAHLIGGNLADAEKDLGKCCFAGERFVFLGMTERAACEVVDRADVCWQLSLEGAETENCCECRHNSDRSSEYQGRNQVNASAAERHCDNRKRARADECYTRVSPVWSVQVGQGNLGTRPELAADAARNRF